jgi:branched-chain amino acid transport system ATP-binding protein
LLSVENLTVRFGGHVAVDAISFAVDASCATGLIGPNGAGKTTIFNAVCGVITPASGSVRLEDRDITTLSTHKRARLGIGRTFQRLEVFGTLSVQDNVRVAVEIRDSWTRRSRDSLRQADELLARVGLADVKDLRVDQLPTGQARLVELARALAIGPKVLLLDEPASGLDDGETEQLGELLRGLAGDGLAVLLVEHDVGLVVGVCAQIYVLDFGRVIASGTADEVQRDERVREAYLGRDHREVAR